MEKEKNSEDFESPKNSIIKVYKINGFKRLEDEIDFKSTSWKRSDGLWESPEGWIVSNKEDAIRVAEYTKKSLQNKQEKETQKEKEFHFPQQNESWKEVVEEQKKATEEEIAEKEREKRIQRRKQLELEELENAKQKKKWITRVLLGLTTLTITGGTYIYFTDPFKPENVFETNKSTTESNSIANSNTIDPTQNTESIANQVSKINSALLLYIVEESIWEAKIKAALNAKRAGQTKWEEITPYLNFDAKAPAVTQRVKLLYLEIEKKPLEIDTDSLANSIKLLNTLLSAREQQALDTIKNLVKKKSIGLGTYPSELVSKLALKEKWISPLGKLNHDITGKNHSKRYIISPTDNRSVGQPVTW